MKRYIGFILGFLLLSGNLSAQIRKIKADPAAPYFSLYLIGDAGEDTISGTALQLLLHQMDQEKESAVVFLGDNAYPHGLEISGSKEKIHISEKKLEAQLDLLKNYSGSAYFIPGNHDWMNGHWKGLQHVKAEAAFVEKYISEKTKTKNKDSGSFFPKDGMPGPSSLLICEGKSTVFQPIRLVVIDTDWWLHKQFFHKVGRTKGKSDRQMEERFFVELDSILSMAKQRGERVVLASHHPMYSNGSHSRKLEPLRFLINCGLLQPMGLVGGNRYLIQNLFQPRYKRMRKRILAIIEKYDNLIYASGHDHNMQYFKFGSNKFIVSGAGSKRTHYRTKNFPSVFEDFSEHGFFKVKFFYGGETEVECWGAKKNGLVFKEGE